MKGETRKKFQCKFNVLGVSRKLRSDSLILIFHSSCDMKTTVQRPVIIHHHCVSRIFTVNLTRHRHKNFDDGAFREETHRRQFCR